MWTQSTSVADRQTDRRTDRQTELLSQRPCNAERRTVIKKENYMKSRKKCPKSMKTDWYHQSVVKKDLRHMRVFIPEVKE